MGGFFFLCWMSGWMKMMGRDGMEWEGWNGQMDGWMDGWTDGWMDGWMDEQINKGMYQRTLCM